jgi:hypothetical protein
MMIGPDGLLLVVPTYLQSPFHLLLESGCLMTIFILGNVKIWTQRPKTLDFISLGMMGYSPSYILIQ